MPRVPPSPFWGIHQFIQITAHGEISARINPNVSEHLTKPSFQCWRGLQGNSSRFAGGISERFKPNIHAHLSAHKYAPGAQTGSYSDFSGAIKRRASPGNTIPCAGVMHRISVRHKKASKAGFQKHPMQGRKTCKNL